MKNWTVVEVKGAMPSDYRTLKSFGTLAEADDWVQAQFADPTTEWEKGMLGIRGIAPERRDNEDTLEQVMTDMLERETEMDLG